MLRKKGSFATEIWQKQLSRNFSQSGTLCVCFCSTGPWNDWYDYYKIGTTKLSGHQIHMISLNKTQNPGVLMHPKMYQYAPRGIIWPPNKLKSDSQYPEWISK